MFSIISISSIVFFGTADIRQKRTISGKANVLKAIILPFYCMRIFIVYYNFKNIDGIYF